jgi:DNA-binding helix-turn-helix protein
MKKVPCLKVVLGEQLKKARKSIPKLSQEQVALALGTERSYVSRMERGLLLPSINVLILLGEIYGIPASTLLLWTEQALAKHVSAQDGK